MWNKVHRANGSETGRGAKATALIWDFIPSLLSLRLGTCQFSELSCEMIGCCPGGR